jgi:hypothetical protein
MKKSLSYYSSDLLQRNGLDVSIKKNKLIITKGFLTLPNDKTVTLESDFIGEIDSESQSIYLLTEIGTGKGVIQVLKKGEGYDRIKYKLFERLAWKDSIIKEWVAIEYVKLNSELDLKNISGGNTIKS